jgi:hypothetical protein
MMQLILILNDGISDAGDGYSDDGYSLSDWDINNDDVRETFTATIAHRYELPSL